MYFAHWYFPFSGFQTSLFFYNCKYCIRNSQWINKFAHWNLPFQYLPTWDAFIKKLIWLFSPYFMTSSSNNFPQDKNIWILNQYDVTSKMKKKKEFHYTSSFSHIKKSLHCIVMQPSAWKVKMYAEKLAKQEVNIYIFIIFMYGFKIMDLLLWNFDYLFNNFNKILFI